MQQVNESTSVEEIGADEVEKLFKFCVNNDDLDLLESKINAFNPLKVLGVDDFEIRHSNVLAWLLNPNGHHGLGDLLFKNALLEILRDRRDGELPKIEDVFSADFSDLEIKREWHNIDLLAFSPSNRLVVVIENKIKASESDNQLKKYAETVDSRYADSKKVFVYLTLDGAAPKNYDRYISFSHGTIHDIVQSAIKLKRDYMHPKVYDFIEQYLRVLEEKTMQESEIAKICSKIYNEHKDAIKMIVDYGKPRLPRESMEQFHMKTNTESFFIKKPTVRMYYSFVPAEWSGVVPETSPYSDKYLAAFSFDFGKYEDNSIALYLVINKFRDDEQESRLEIIDRLKSISEEKNYKMKFNANSKTSTIIASKTAKLKSNDPDRIVEQMVSLFNEMKASDAFTALDEVVRAYWGRKEDIYA